MVTKSRRRLISAIVRYTILTVWGMVAFFPIYWMVSTSFKPDIQWFAWHTGLFSGPTDADQLHECLAGCRGICPDPICNLLPDAVGFPLNSTVIAFSSTFLSVAFGSRSCLRRLALSHPVGSAHVSAADAAHDPADRRRRTTVTLLLALGLLDTRIGVIMVYFLTTLPYAVWMTKSFIDEVPREVEQAAEILGASRWRTVFEIVLP